MSKTPDEHLDALATNPLAAEPPTTVRFETVEDAMVARALAGREFFRLFVTGDLYPKEANAVALCKLAERVAAVTGDDEQVARLLAASALNRRADAYGNGTPRYTAKQLATCVEMARAVVTNGGAPTADGDALDLKTAAERATPENLRPVEPVAWGIAYRARVVLFAAREKLGKSTFVTAAAAAVTKGAPFLGEPTAPGDVLWVSSDIEAEADVVQRLARFGADLNRVHVLYPRGADDLAAALARCSDAVMVVVDTLHPLVAARVETASQADGWARVLPEFNRLAQAHDVAIVLNHHAPANDEKKGYRDSTAIGGWVDGIVIMRAASRRETARACEAVYRFAGGAPRTWAVALDPTGDRFRRDADATSDDGPGRPLTDKEQAALNAIPGGTRLRAGEWERASALAHGTFDRARKTLLARGLVEYDAVTRCYARPEF